MNKDKGNKKNKKGKKNQYPSFPKKSNRNKNIATQRLHRAHRFRALSSPLQSSRKMFSPKQTGTNRVHNQEICLPMLIFHHGGTPRVVVCFAVFCHSKINNFRDNIFFIPTSSSSLMSVKFSQISHAPRFHVHLFLLRIRLSNYSHRMEIDKIDFERRVVIVVL